MHERVMLSTDNEIYIETKIWNRLASNNNPVNRFLYDRKGSAELVKCTLL